MDESTASTEDSEPGSQTPIRGKLARLLEEYDLQYLGRELEVRWTHPDDSKSLRELATWFNHRLLETVLEEAGMSPLDGEVENLYRLLTAEDVSPGESTQAKRRLERAGIDVKPLLGDFVSRQAIHTYLTDVREVSYDHETKDPLKNAQSYLRDFQDRTRTITESRIEQLDKAGHISVESPRVLVDIQVLCENCNRLYSFEELMEQRACACHSSEGERA